jgi:hypothetical protein
MIARDHDDLCQSASRDTILSIHWFRYVDRDVVSVWTRANGRSGRDTERSAHTFSIFEPPGVRRKSSIDNVLEEAIDATLDLLGIWLL